MFLCFLKVVDLLFAPEISADDEIGYLQMLIIDHHTNFVQLYPECTVTPKMHYMVHMPRLILK